MLGEGRSRTKTRVHGKLPFRDQQFAARYQRLRGIPQPILGNYVREILRDSTGVQSVLDVDAGTGQFTVALASALPQARVESLEPAPAMYRQLARQVRLAKVGNVSMRLASLDDVRRGSRFDLVLLSEVV